MKWWSFGCKCGAAIEIRSVVRPLDTDATCPDCSESSLSQMVFLASWDADGKRYDAKGKVVAEATERLINLGCTPEVARKLAEIMGPSTATLGEAIDMIMRRKSLP